jgi:hypothetical protein
MTAPTDTIQRIDRLTRQVMRPLQWPLLILAVGLVAEGIAGGITYLTTSDPVRAALVAVAVGAVASAIALIPLLDTVRRRAFVVRAVA